MAQVDAGDRNALLAQHFLGVLAVVFIRGIDQDARAEGFVALLHGVTFAAGSGCINPQTHGFFGLAARHAADGSEQGLQRAGGK